MECDLLGCCALSWELEYSCYSILCYSILFRFTFASSRISLFSFEYGGWDGLGWQTTAMHSLHLPGEERRGEDRVKAHVKMTIGTVKDVDEAISLLLLFLVLSSPSHSRGL
jgi:hypothetical protein